MYICKVRCGTVAGMVTPKRSMSTEGEIIQVSVLPYRYLIFCSFDQNNSFSTAHYVFRPLHEDLYIVIGLR
jgi:hypothetical protein